VVERTSQSMLSREVVSMSQLSSSASQLADPRSIRAIAPGLSNLTTNHTPVDANVSVSVNVDVLILDCLLLGIRITRSRTDFRKPPK
jgi:hypothetical protein